MRVKGVGRIAFMIVGGLAGAAGGCERSELPKMPQRPTPMVQVATARTEEQPVYLPAIGRAVSTEVVSVIPQVGGQIVAAHVSDGDVLKRGQLMFEIDPRPFEAMLNSAKATLAQSVAELEMAQIEHRRMQDMAVNQAATALELDQARIGVDVAVAKRDAAQASLRMAELNLEYTKIAAPLDGKAGARMVDPGNIVKANENALQVIRRLDPIYVEFTLNEREFNTLREAVAARTVERGGTLDVEIQGGPVHTRMESGTNGIATSQPESPANISRVGKLSFVDNAVDTQTGTVKMRARVDNADHWLWPGQFVTVRAVLRRQEMVLIPAKAQQVGAQGPFVYVVGSGQAGDVAELRPVKAGQTYGEDVAIYSGVNSGERVILTGLAMIQPGGPVKVFDPAMMGGGATGGGNGGGNHAGAGGAGGATSQPASAPSSGESHEHGS